MARGEWGTDRDGQRPEGREEIEGCCVLGRRNVNKAHKYRKMSLGNLLFFTPIQRRFKNHIFY